VRPRVQIGAATSLHQRQPQAYCDAFFKVLAPRYLFFFLLGSIYFRFSDLLIGLVVMRLIRVNFMVLYWI
jgi:hypothetical protein